MTDSSSTIFRRIAIDEKTVKSWVGILKHLYYGFEIRPYFKNVVSKRQVLPDDSLAGNPNFRGGLSPRFLAR